MTPEDRFDSAGPTTRTCMRWLDAPEVSFSPQPIPPHLTEAQRNARESFDLDTFMAALPPAGTAALTTKGAAGWRLQERFTTDIPEPLLREMARDVLGATRCSAQYLAALRIVLGNEAEAERRGLILELNLRVSFASPKVMRQIIGQMKAAGITHGVAVGLGAGRRQEVQCFGEQAARPRLDPAAELEARDRAHEAANYARWVADGCPEVPVELHGITDADVPY